MGSLLTSLLGGDISGSVLVAAMDTLYNVTLLEILGPMPHLGLVDYLAIASAGTALGVALAIAIKTKNYLFAAIPSLLFTVIALLGGLVLAFSVSAPGICSPSNATAVNETELFSLGGLFGVLGAIIASVAGAGTERVLGIIGVITGLVGVGLAVSEAKQIHNSCHF